MRVTTVTRLTRLIVVLFCLLCTGTVFAQPEETHPFLQLLEIVPDEPAAHENFSYVDFRAVTEGREGAVTVTTGEQFEALNAGQSSERDLFWAAYFGISSGPADFLRNLRSLAEGMSEVTGIDPFSVERTLTYGTPPSVVDVYAGNFDAAQIAVAHSQRDYVENVVAGDWTLWCGNEECDGMEMDLRSRDPANPFGGSLGRQQSVLVGEDLVASSANTEQLESLAEAAAGNTDTLADNPNYRAAAEAITQEGLLRQTWFINPSLISPLTESAFMEALGSQMTPEQIKAILAELTENFEPIPQYNLLAIADTTTESEQTALVALVYNDADDAETASEELTRRIDTYVSLSTNAPLREMLEERGLTAVETAVYESDDRAVLLVQLRGTLAPAEPEEGSSQLTSSSLIFNLLTRMIMQRDTGWLATMP